jgi:hypothetical protein
MTKQHPLTPPADLEFQWGNEAPLDYGGYGQRSVRERWLINKAAEWAADQELEACCEWLEDTDCDDPQEVANHLRNARRPQSLKKQALRKLKEVQALLQFKNVDTAVLRRALEALPE